MIYSLYQKEDFFQVEKLLRKGVELEVIVGFKEISRFFSFDYQELEGLLETFKDQNKIKVYLQWDVLMTESRFAAIFTRMKQLGVFSHPVFDGIRVQDPGALYALKDIEYPKEVHYIVEQGNHNLIGLKSWLDFWPSGIKRLVLSPELPSAMIRDFQEAISCSLEVLAFGPILLFYTPRQLVSPLYGEADDEKERHEVMGTSEESPHKGFPIIENSHGTFMLNTKDQFLFDELEAIEACKGVHWRVDFICGHERLPLEEFYEYLSKNEFSSILRDYQRPTTKGFFRVNKTDVLFKKLKNFRLQDRGESYLGEVVDVKKKEHIAILIKGQNKSLKNGDEISFLSPEGREKKMRVGKMTDALGNEMITAHTGDIIFLSHLGGLSVRTMVFHH